MILAAAKARRTGCSPTNDRGIPLGATTELDRTSGLALARVVKRAALAAGPEAERFSGRSLRLGFVTTAAQRRCSERSIANQTGRRSMVELRGYIATSGGPMSSRTMRR